MNERNDGGPAFPVFERVDEFNDAAGVWTHRDVPMGGMSLRDYFAGQALAGLLATAATGKEYWTLNGGTDRHGIDVMAYALADAMLKARASR